MELTVKEIEAIASVRANKNRKVNWSKKYTYPTYILAIIIFASFLGSVLIPVENVYVSSNGENKIIVDRDKDKAFVNGVEYARDYSQGKNAILMRIIDRIMLVSIVLLALIYVYWYYKVKKPYVKSFVKYWQEHKELME